MYPSGVASVFFFSLFLQGLPRVTCEDIGTVEFISIGVSLGLAVFIVVFLAFFWWRAQNAYPLDARSRDIGIYNSAVAADQTGPRSEPGISTSTSQL
ncbi:unnamed protein product [Porites evermanni]|uniref:Uncharacterized protein n=1 Tax=Porites evermanni TaxID=104178 RepID=A0ABN8LME7_9CNID|nr:unnamed protein product [Porites evermanni]